MKIYRFYISIHSTASKCRHKRECLSGQARQARPNRPAIAKPPSNWPPQQLQRERRQPGCDRAGLDDPCERESNSKPLDGGGKKFAARTRLRPAASMGLMEPTGHR